MKDETYKRLRHEPESWTVEVHTVEVYVGTGGDHQDEFLRGKRPRDLLRGRSYRNPTGFRRWVKVAQSCDLCYTCVMGIWESKNRHKYLLQYHIISYASIERNCRCQNLPVV